LLRALLHGTDEPSLQQQPPDFGLRVVAAMECISTVALDECSAHNPSIDSSTAATTATTAITQTTISRALGLPRSSLDMLVELLLMAGSQGHMRELVRSMAGLMSLLSLRTWLLLLRVLHIGRAPPEALLARSKTSCRVCVCVCVCVCCVCICVCCVCARFASVCAVPSICASLCRSCDTCPPQASCSSGRPHSQMSPQPCPE
jgi:hypothetical protein